MNIDKTKRPLTQTHEAFQDPRCAVPMLVVVYARYEPERVGEVLRPPSGAKSAVFGRDSGGEVEVLSLLRQRPGLNINAGTLSPKWTGIGRNQLEISLCDECVFLRQGSGASLRINGALKAESLVNPGDIVELVWPGANEEEEIIELIFVVTRRPTRFTPWSVPDSLRPEGYGKPDRFRLLGESPAIWRARFQLRNASAVNNPILFVGELGSGKERTSRRFIEINLRQNASYYDHISHDFSADTLPNLLQQAISERKALRIFEVDRLDPLVMEQLKLYLRGRSRDQAQETSTAIIIGVSNKGTISPHLRSLFSQSVVYLPSINERLEDLPLLALQCLKELRRQHPGIKEASDRFFQGGPLLTLPPDVILRLLRHQWTSGLHEIPSLLESMLMETYPSKIQYIAEGLPSLTPSRLVSQWVDDLRACQFSLDIYLEKTDFGEKTYKNHIRAAIGSALYAHDGDLRQALLELAGLSLEQEDLWLSSRELLNLYQQWKRWQQSLNKGSTYKIYPNAESEYTVKMHRLGLVNNTDFLDMHAVKRPDKEFLLKDQATGFAPN